MDAKVMDAMVAAQPLDLAKAKVIADKFDIKFRAVIAAAKRNDLDYVNVKRVSKTGQPVASKADLVGQIAAKFDLDVEDLAGLDKATKTALQALVG